MAVCSQCGAEVAADVRFCAQCGARLAPAEPPAPPATPAATRLDSPAATVILPGPSAAPPTQRLDTPPAPAGDPPPPPAAPAPAPTFVVPPAAPQAAAPPRKRRVGLIVAIIGACAVLLCLLAGGGLLLLSRVVGDSIPEPDASELVADPFGPMVLSDTFEQPAGSAFGAQSADEASFAFDDGSYTITVNRAGFLSWSNAQAAFGDAAVEVDATIEGEGDGEAGVMFRYQDSRNFYLFSVGADGTYTLVRYLDDAPTALVATTESPAIRGAGVLNRLRVETEGETIRLFVNGELLTELTDDAFARGQIGLAATAGETAGLTVRFDDFVVRERQ